MITTTGIQSDNWSGRIPIELSLAPTSLSSPNMPSPLYVLVSRHTYLHTGLQSAVLRLYKYAPAVCCLSSSSIFSSSSSLRHNYGSSSNDGMIRKRQEEDDDDDDNEEHCDDDGNNHEEYKKKNVKTNTGGVIVGRETNQRQQHEVSFPVCWFEDVDSQFALRWHLFVGVLWDMKQTQKRNQATTTTTNNTKQMKRKHNGQQRLPWKIRLHFTQYPSSQILPLDNDVDRSNNGHNSDRNHVLTTIERYFMNSLKQALFLQHATSKVAKMTISKQIHGQLWDSIVTNNYQLYQQVNTDLQLLTTTTATTNSTSTNNINNSSTDGHVIPNLLPIRLFVNATKPPIQRPCRITMESSSDSRQIITTLGSLFVEWCPTLFEIKDENNGIITPKHSETTWTIQGIQDIELSTCLVDLWKSLSYPDHFLYIVVSTNTR